MEETNKHLTTTKQKFDKYQKAHVTSNTDHRMASDSLKGFREKKKSFVLVHSQSSFLCCPVSAPDVCKKIEFLN